MRISNYHVAGRGLPASPLLILFIHNNVVITVENMATLNRVLFLKNYYLSSTYIDSKKPLLSLQCCTLIFMQYLTGAPFAWAGLSRTVMVVAVSLRKASDPSYFPIVGAAESASVSNTDSAHHLTNSRTLIISKWGRVDNLTPEILVVTFSVAAWPNPLEVDARIESWYVTPGWSWGKRWLVALEGRDTVRPDPSRVTEGSNECRPQQLICDGADRQNVGADVPSHQSGTIIISKLGDLILYDDSVGFRGFLPVKQDTVFRWNSSQRLTGDRTWNC